MRLMFRRLFQFCVPSVVGACLAALVVGLAETAPLTYGVVEALGGVGFLLLFALPFGIAASLLGRLLYSAWDVPGLLSPLVDRRGAAPRFVAWVIFLVLSAVALALGSFQGVRLLFANTRMHALVSLGTPLVVLAIATGLLCVSRPIVNLLDSLFSRVEKRRSAADKGPLFTPLAISIAVALSCALSALVAWFAFILPAVVHLDISFLFYLIGFVLLLVLFPMGWPRISFSRPIQGAVASVALLSAITCFAAASWVRYERPHRMLELWGDTQLAGWAIDTLYDVQGLRVDLSLEGIEPTPIPGASHPNVVIISIDTVRADHTPVYGGKARMPALAKFATTSAVFERAYATGNVTRRSLPTMATGLSPHRIRGRVAGWALKMDPRHILLAERFRSGGYNTAGFFCCRSHFGRDHKLGLIRGLETVEVEYKAEPLTQKALQWLRDRGTSPTPLFMWVHYIEPHNWEQDQKPKDGLRTIQKRYDKSLEVVDSSLGHLLDGIREQLGDDTIIVVVADHGEGLGDHKAKKHGVSLYNSEIHIPLLIAGPGIAPTRIEQAIGLVDIAPTLLHLAGFEAPGMPQMDGLSVAPELLGEREDRLGAGEAYSVMVVDRSVKDGSYALMSGHYKLIEQADDKFELYNLTADPRERKNLKVTAKPLFEAMKARLRRRQKMDSVSPF